MLAERKRRYLLVMASQIAENDGTAGPSHRYILTGTRLVAYDRLDGLRAKTGCAGSLAEVFEKMVHPQSAEQIESYFNRPKA